MPVDLVTVTRVGGGRKAVLPRAALKHLKGYRETAQSARATTADGTPAVESARTTKAATAAKES